MTMRISILAVLIWCHTLQSYGQACNSGGCSNINNQFPSATFSTTSATWTTVSTQMNAGNWTLFNVTNGNTYEWTTCNLFGGQQGWDAQLTLFNNATGNILCYQGNSNLSSCPNAPYLQYTATFTGVVKLLITVNSCQFNSGSPYATLVWRQYAAAAPVCTAPSVTVNNGTGVTSVTLSANVSGGSGGSILYKWYAGNTCSGTVLGTNATYTTNVGGTFSCKAYISGFESSCYNCDNATATIGTPPPCTAPALTVNDGNGSSFVTLSANVTGGTGGTLMYKWYAGNACSGTVLGTNATYTTNVSGVFSCKAYINGFESTCYNCDDATATIGTPPTCTNPVASVTGGTGTGSVTLTCNATGGSGGTIMYKWYAGNVCAGTVLGTNAAYTTNISGTFSCKAYINGFESSCFSCNNGAAVVNAPALNYIDVAGLRVYADNVPSSGNPRTVSGNVHIIPLSGCSAASNVLCISGNVSVNTTTNIINGNGLVYCKGIGSFGTVNLYNGTYTFTALNDMLLFPSASIPANMLFTMAEFPVSIKTIQVKCNGIKVAGKFKMTEALSYVNISAPIDVNFSDLYFTTAGIDLAGTIALNNIKIKRNVGLEHLTLSFDSYASEFEGSTRILSPHFNIDAAALIKKKQLNRISVGVASVTQAIPLGTTGLAIDSIGGAMENMSTLSTQPLNLKFGARIIPLIYPGLDLSALGHCVMEANYKWGTSLDANAKLNLLGTDALNAGFSLSPCLLQLSAGVNLYNVVKGNAQLSISKPGANIKLQGNFNANLTIPSFNKPVILAAIVSPWFGTTLANTNNYISNNYLAGYLKLNILPVPFYYVLSRNPNWSFEFGKNIHIIPVEAQPSLFGKTLNYSFSITDPTEYAMIAAYGNNKVPELNLFLGTGDTVRYKNRERFPYITYITDTARSMCVIVMRNPSRGTYYVHSPLADSIQVVSLNQPPKIVINTVLNSTATNELQVAFTASDPDNDARITFGLDRDNNNANGIVMADSISENSTNGNVTLNYAGIKTGIYYLYASITDSIGQNYYVYHDVPLKIISGQSFNPPSGLTVTPNDTSLVIHFSKNNTVPLNYILHYSRKQGELSLNADNFPLGDTDHAIIKTLPPGRYYEIAVAALDSAGNESNLSNKVSLTWNGSGINNYPVFINPSIQRKVKAGTMYNLNLQATDPDNDPLSYQLINAPAGATINNNGLLSWLPGQGDIGYHQFSIKVTDPAGADDSLAFETLVYDSVTTKPVITFNKTQFDTYNEKGIIEIADRFFAVEDNISAVMMRVYSTSDPVGMMVQARKTNGYLPTYSSLLSFTPGPGGSNTIHVDKADTIWASYKNPGSGDSIKNFALFNYLKADFLLKDSICSADTIYFKGASKGTNLFYHWNFDDGAFSTARDPWHVFPVVQGKGIKKYTVRLVATNVYGSSDTINKVVVVYNKPVASISVTGSLNLCKGEYAVLSAGSADNYKWSDGSILPAVIASRPGIYKVTVSNGNKCFAADSVTVKVNALPLADAGHTVYINARAKVTIGGTPTASGNGPFTYLWSPASGTKMDSIANPWIAPLTSAFYKVKITDKNGCTATDSVRVNVTGNIIFPNPAGNTITVSISDIQNGNYSLAFYNSNGKLIKLEKIKVTGNALYRSVRIENFVAGNYIVSLFNSDTKISMQFIKGK